MTSSAAQAARQAAIARVVAEVERKREALAARLLAGDFDLADARRRNARMPGRLGELWSRFIELPPPAQVEAVEAQAFHGMAWQSLLQCSPFLVGRP